jgi:acyl-CoA synthetase (NDP forming)
VLRDVTFRVAPLTRHDGEEMVRELRGYPLLIGARGQPPRDMDALVNLLLSVSQMVMERANIEELDLNPVRLFEHGLLVLDARLVVKKNDGQNDS